MLKKVARLLAIAVCAAWLLSPLEQAHAACVGYGVTVSPFAFETITVSTVAVGFTTATFAPAGQTASMAIVTVESNPIRYRSDGTAPTSAVGHPAVANDQIEVCGVKAVKNFQAIRSGGSDATMDVTYFSGG